jgi:cellulose synthase/poly-beta-1,6-N-acetylglucosamine synthase-like glycosyltransferase
MPVTFIGYGDCVFIQTFIFALSLILSFLFSLYGFNYYYLLNASRRYRTPPLPEHSRDLPVVSIHLPIYNERNVIRRLVAACAAMAQAYAIEKVKILILDDSDDTTVQEVDQVVKEFQEKNFQIEVLRRGGRAGFKAGALQAGLDHTNEEFIAIFDADFVPPADFLLRTLPYFDGDETLGIVQSRWTYLNKDYSLVTRAISHAIDVHFLVEQPGRYAAGVFQNFNGSGGVLRKRAIVEAGGWQSDTLAEDLDLSYRIQMLGYRILYLRDLVCPCEIPPTVPSFKLQQGRWACGASTAAIKILPGLLRDRKLGIKQRLQAFIHLTGYMVQPLIVFSFLLGCLAVLLGVNSLRAYQSFYMLPGFNIVSATKAARMIFMQNLVWGILAPFIILCTLAPLASLVCTLKFQNLPVSKNLASLAVLLLMCFGMSLSMLRGIGRAVSAKRPLEWIRTPKYAEIKNKKDWSKDKDQVPFDMLWIWELLFVMLGLWAILSAIQHKNFSGLFILVPFTMSYAFVLLFSVLQSRRASA